MRKRNVIFRIIVAGLVCGGVLFFCFVSERQAITALAQNTPEEPIVPVMEIQHEFLPETLQATPQMESMAAPEPTPEPTPIPREPIVLNFTAEQGTLYTEEMVIAWQAQIEGYLTRATEEEAEQLNQDLEMCQKILSLLNYQVKKHETLVQVLAKTVTREIGGLKEKSCYSSVNMERAAVVWCILNRVDHNYDTSVDGETLAKRISRTTKARHQFAYSYSSRIFAGTKEISIDVLVRWILEKYGYESGRVLPSNYRYFAGRGTHNHFRTHHNTKKATYWDWSLPDPYLTKLEGDLVK